MKNRISELLGEIESLKVSKIEEIEVLRIKYLSKKGEIANLMNDFRDVPADQKREVGILLNELKERAQDRINELRDSFDDSGSGDDSIDLTRTAYPQPLGSRHPLSLGEKRNL